MGSNLYYRRYIEKMIAANPVQIVVTRTVKQDDGFGGVITEPVTLPTQTVTLYNRRTMRERVSDAGVHVGTTISRVTKLLAAGDADLQAGDEFEHGGRTWRVLEPIGYLGVCLQAELEVVE
jgi:hypothetical protein